MQHPPAGAEKRGAGSTSLTLPQPRLRLALVISTGPMLAHVVEARRRWVRTLVTSSGVMETAGGEESMAVM